MSTYSVPHVFIPENEYNKFEISPFSFKNSNLKIEEFLAYFINDFFPNSLAFIRVYNTYCMH